MVFILFDALAAGHVTHLGYERDTTPNLDRLASEAWTFERAFAPAPYTLASVASLMTGRLPDTHDLVHNSHRLPAEEETLPEVLARAGYRTYGAVSNLNASSLCGLDQGFERYRETYRPEGQKERPRGGDAPVQDQVALRASEDWEQLNLTKADEFPPILRTWLEELPPPGGDRRVFYYLHVLEPHAPYQPPEEYRGRYLDPAYRGAFLEGDTETLVSSNRGELAASAEDVEAVRALYDANLRYADAMLGELLAVLEEAGLYEEALIVVTSDHGEAFWQHGLWGHNDQLFDEMLRVPLVLRFPDAWQVEPARVRRLSSLVDLLPSLASWTGARATGDLDGYPIELEAGPEEELEGRALVLRTHHRLASFALRTDLEKLLMLRDPEGGELDRFEFYRLDGDPAEERPLAIEGDPEAEGLRRELVDWGREAFGDEAVLQVLGVAEVGPEERALLEQLGYTE